MTIKRSSIVIAFALGLLLTACGPGLPEDQEQYSPLHRILLWHAWEGESAEALDQLLIKFMTVYPGIRVVQRPFSIKNDSDLRAFKAMFYDRARMGLGPDLMIAPVSLELEFAEAGVLQELSGYYVETTVYLSTAVKQLRIGDELYALPLSLYTRVLYYNKELVSEPPTTLDGLLSQAAEGKRVALGTGFAEAFWGIQAFGGQLYDEQGQLALDQGGFADWLDWLRTAQKSPGMILSDDDDFLALSFMNGEAAYYVGEVASLPSIQEHLGEDGIGVAPLPAGPSGPSGPMLHCEALMFSTASSSAQTEQALLLAQFLTNAEQQTKLAQQIGKVPVHIQARNEVDPRLSPIVAAFVVQTKTAVAVPNIPQLFTVMTYGGEAYDQVLEGVLEPRKAADQLVKRVKAMSAWSSPAGQ